MEIWNKLSYISNKKIILLLVCAFLSQGIFSQNLLKERIRRIPSRKRSVYLDSGVIHNGAPKKTSKLKAIRHNYSKKLGYERLVLDFSTNELPRVYGFIASKEKKLYLDLFKTDLPSSLNSFGDSKFVDSVNFFPIQNDTLSVEVLFKKNMTLDVFYLSNPARLVIDIKN